MAGKILFNRREQFGMKRVLALEGIVLEHRDIVHANQVLGGKLCQAAVNFHRDHGSRGGSHTQLQIWRADGTDVSFSGLKDAEQAAAFIHNWTRADSAAHSSAPAPSTGWQPPGAS